MAELDYQLFGWAGEDESERAWGTPEIAGEFSEFQLIGDAPTEPKRVCAWDSWEQLGFDINQTILRRQLIGDCVSFGAAIAIAAVAGHEIVRLGERETLKVPFPPYLYGTGRLAPEAGNGRIRSRDGSLGSWQAIAVKKYGVLRSDYDNVPDYSGRVAGNWGTRWRYLEPFIDEANDHLIRDTAPLRSVDSVVEAVTNGYYPTIASNRGFNMRLRDSKGKSWFTGRANWPHQMSILAIDIVPELCFYIRNQWGSAHGRQLDGPDGGGWVTADTMHSWLRMRGCECIAYSLFDGWPSEDKKPRNYLA